MPRRKNDGLGKFGGRAPGTLNKATADVKALAQVHGAEAIAKLLELMRSGESETIQHAAANSLLDRGYGKVQQTVEIAAREEQREIRIIEIVGITPQQLADRRSSEIEITPPLPL